MSRIRFRFAAARGARWTAAAVLAISPVPARDPVAAWIALGVLLLAAAIFGIYTIRLARKSPRRPRP